MMYRGVTVMPPSVKKGERFRAQYTMSRDMLIHLGIFRYAITAAHAWDIVSWTFRRCLSDLNDPDPRRTAVYDKYEGAVRALVDSLVARKKSGGQKRRRVTRTATETKAPILR